MIHPGKKLIEEIRDRNWTQKQFAVFVGKKNSEVNELIKGKRNITIQWDLILSEVLGTPEKYWINMQTDYDYEILKQEREKQKMEQKQGFEVVSDISKEGIQDTVDEDAYKEDFSPIVTQAQNSDVVSSQSGGDFIDDKKDSLSQAYAVGNASQDDREVISEEDIQKKKEMKKIFINF